MFQLIELWETFLIQLDAEEDEEPYYKPPVVTPPANQENQAPPVTAGNGEHEE
jgi:sorting nexin-1/2